MLRKNQRSPKISRFIMICLLQLRLIFCCSCVLRLASCLSASAEAYFFCSCVLHCTYSREREREREYWRKRWKAKSKKWGGYCWLLLSVVPKRVDVISKCVVVWDIGICRIKNVWRGKNIKWVMILLLMVHLLFVIWKIKK